MKWSCEPLNGGVKCNRAVVSCKLKGVTERAGHLLMCTVYRTVTACLATTGDSVPINDPKPRMKTGWITHRIATLCQMKYSTLTKDVYPNRVGLEGQKPKVHYNLL